MFPMTVITHRVLFQCPGIKTHEGFVSLIINNFFGKWSFYGPHMYEKRYGGLL